MSDAKAKESQRKQVRYAVSDDCRLRAAIKLRSADSATAAKDWSGTLVDMSTGGAHIQISLGAVAYKGDDCVLKLAHGAVKIEVRGTLVHYVCSARFSVCGLRFDNSADKAYQHFLQPIIASAALKAGETGVEPGRYREEYPGPGQTKLVVWRDSKPAGAVVAFDYTMVRYSAVLVAAGPDMAKNKQQVGFKSAGSGVPLSPAQEAEARWEFSLAASNLPTAIAPDIRKFLRLVS
ncbi:MAG: PilZ domain-containing protein [Lacunisphaera sp.]|nr:PilZ domain-containing protein [Lacunisphaera sp.]